MTDLEKYEIVNCCETLEELSEAIKTIGETNKLNLIQGRINLIQGRTNLFDANKMAVACLNINYLNIRNLTRNYGIRQQAFMILFYKNKK